MAPSIWNILAIWCLGAVLAVEYAVVLAERERARREQNERRKARYR